MSEYVETNNGGFSRYWEIKKLHEMAIIESGKREKGGAKRQGSVLSIGGEHISKDGRIILNTPKYISEEFYKKLRSGKVKIDDVLTVKDGTLTGKVAYVNKMITDKMAVNEHVFIVRSKNKNAMIPLYLFYVLRSDVMQDQIRSAFHGLIGGVKRSEIEDLIIPVPPLEEQRKIVEILQKASEIHLVLKDYITQTRDSINVLRRKIMSELVTKGIGHNEYVETDIGEVPKEWKIVELGDISEPGKETADPIKEDISMPFLGLEHVDSGDIRIRRYGDASEVKSRKYRFYKNDILYGKLRPYLDKAVISDINGICSTDLIVLKTKNVVLPGFLVWILHAKRFIDYATLTMTGTNHPRTSWKSIRTFKIGLPPLEEERKIIEILQKADELYSQLNDFIQNMEDEADSLFRAILRLSVTGKLTEKWRGKVIFLRSVIIPYVVYQAMKIKGRPVYMTELMKYLFLLQKEYNINLAYNFEPYKYGPFTSQAYRDLENLKDKIEIKEVKDAVDKSLITSRELPQLDQNIANTIKDLLNRFGNKSLKELLSYVYKKYPEYTVRSELNLDDFIN